MIHGFRYSINDIRYFLKPHFCPRCQTRLNTVKVSKVVNSKSPEAKDFDFSTSDGYMTVNIKFILKEFECSNCGCHLTVEELKQQERIL